ncbi:restriction endonuclease subunit S [Arthrobacter sp. CAL618]|uniref:restriction endonuclease subunit S n=1 Tax=Arthrobacter sp. CAL618 TaxID=1055770 RepID=UPI0004011D70|nr:restriction endonuclease subunit S [Arthrobacter sp. CAL618]
MSEWVRSILGDLCKLKAGSAFPQAEQGGANSDYPFVKVSDLSSNSKYLQQSNNWITEEQLERLRPALAPAGAVLFAKIGEGLRNERFRVAVRPTAFDNNLMSAMAKPERCTVDFLFYLLATINVSTYVEGSALPYLKQSVLQQVEVHVPCLREQQAIAEVLGALDDKIAANTKLSRSASDLAELEFRRLMLRSHESVTMAQVLTLEYGKSLPAVKRTNGPVKVYGSGGIVGRHTEALCDGPGVVVGRKGTAGAVHWASGPFFPIDTTFWAKPSTEWISPIFSYFLLKSLRLDEMNSDSAVPGLNRNEAHAIAVRRPESDQLRDFTTSAMELFDVVSQMDRENELLAMTRDTLLPQLMSGKLRAKEAQALVEELV